MKTVYFRYNYNITSINQIKGEGIMKTKVLLFAMVWAAMHLSLMKAGAQEVNDLNAKRWSMPVSLHAQPMLVAEQEDEQPTTNESDEKKVLTVELTDGLTLAEALGDDRYTVDSLIVKGFMPQSDFPVLYDLALWGRMTGLNMKHCKVEGDSIPSNAFFYNVQGNGKLYDEQTHEQLKQNTYYCLNYIKLPEELKTIGDSAFKHSYPLTRVLHLKGELELPEGLTDIGESAFGCHWSMSCHRMVGTLRFPSTVRRIGYGAFSGNWFNTIVLPDPDVEIGPFTFFASHKLREVVFPEGITRLADAMFKLSNFGDKEELVLPETIEELGIQTFALCNLKRVVLPTHLKKIPDGCFAQVPLKEINLPEGLEEIGDEAYVVYKESYSPPYGKYQMIDEITIPNSVHTIGRYAFYEQDFKTIHLPASLTQIGVRAFYKKDMQYNKPCEVYAYNPVPPTLIMDDEEDYDNIFRAFNENDWQDSEYLMRTLYVPEGARDAYMADRSWNLDYFKEIVEMTQAGIVETEKDCMADGEADIFDMNGRLIGKTMVNGQSIDTTELQRGIYIVRKGNASKKIVVK